MLFVNQFYSPDEAATSQLLTDVTEAAAATHVLVTVVCGSASYAGRSGTQPPQGVVVHRIPATGFGHGKIRKLASYVSFFVGAAWRMLREDADTVVTMTTPPLLGLTGLIAQLRRGSRHVIWEMDLYPDAAVELGLFSRGGIMDWITGLVADLPRRRADAIIVLGPCMAERLARRRIGNVPVHVVHNWANGAEIVPMPFSRKGSLGIFYSGNMGHLHDFETLAPVVVDLAPRPEFRFQFTGGGPMFHSLRSTWRYCEFGPYRQRSDLSTAFGANDVGLVTQKAHSAGTLVPSKSYGIMAAGRPILYIGPAEATVARIVEEHKVGWRIANGDSAGLKALLWRLWRDPDLVESAGHRARAVFEHHFDRHPQVQAILDVCRS